MAKVGIFDSGVGGLSVLKEIRHLLPSVDIVYYGDNANCPYGPKGEEFIQHRSVEITDFLLTKNVDALVIACNTATSYARQYLRDHYDLPIIGMVPAVKPAAINSRTRVIGVLATFGTLNADLYKYIKTEYGAGVRIIEHIGQGFVELVENFEVDGEHVEEVVESNIKQMVAEGADIIVLGCTHYPFLKEAIEKVANRLKPSNDYDIVVLDPAPAVAKHLDTILRDGGFDLNNDNPTIELLSSGDDSVLKKLYDKYCK